MNGKLCMKNGFMLKCTSFGKYRSHVLMVLEKMSCHSSGIFKPLNILSQVESTSLLDDMESINGWLLFTCTCHLLSKLVLWLEVIPNCEFETFFFPGHLGEVIPNCKFETEI